MSRRLTCPRKMHGEEGSLPLALLAAVVVAGMVSVLLARTVAGERAVRFDRDFAEALQVADVGVNRGLFALNEGQTPPTAAAPETLTVDGIDYTWHATQVSHREWEIVSESQTVSDVRRRLVATVEDQPLFFPGAFGDKLIALNGASTDVDSYNSDPGCTGPASACGWGNTTSDRDEQNFGTGNGSLGTNEDFDFSGGVDVRPGGAFLYDWTDNPGNNITSTDPFGDRCTGVECTTEFVSTVPERLDLASSERMEFITSKFASNGACSNSSSTRQRNTWSIGAKNQTTTLTSYYTNKGGTGTPANNDPTDPDFTNFYCAESLDILGDLKLDPSVTPDNPVVIFVKDYVTVPNSGTKVACHGSASTTWCDKNDPRNVLPQASRLQIYVAGANAGGGSGSDISFKSQVMFAGVVYAPLSRCGGTGGGGIDVYGSIICSTMDNVGNWDFHYDDALGTRGAGQFSVAFWREVPPTP